MRGLTGVVVVAGFTGPPTIHFKFITKCDNLLYYKVRWSLISKCDSFFITKCDKCYCKVRQVLQSAIEHDVDFSVARKQDKLNKQIRPRITSELE